ncbi:MAG: hypothetical protein ABI782_12540 [Anaerolineaceae bacterium]
MDAQDDFRFDVRHIRTCERCFIKYDWRRSPSPSLKMTYCSSLCERADLGFTIEALLRIERDPATVRSAALVAQAA